MEPDRNMILTMIEESFNINHIKQIGINELCRKIMINRMECVKMVNTERILTEFQTLVSMDSESYEEREIADYLTKKLQELGMEVFEDTAGKKLAKQRERAGKSAQKSAGNIYGYLKGTKEGEPILFSSHMDTVSPGIGKKAVIHEDGKITSDGTTVLGADDLGGIVSILEMLTVIKENGLDHPDLEVLFPVAEEPYAQGSRVFDYEKIKAKMAYVFDLSGAIGTAATAAPSIVSFQIQVRGRSAHAGFCPEAGIHAIAIASRAIAGLPYGWVEKDTSVNIGTITGGTARNIVPDQVMLTGEIRSLNHEKALGWMHRIEEKFRQEAETAGGMAEVSFVEEFRAYKIEETEKVAAHYVKACHQAGIMETPLITTFGGSDNNHFTAHGIRGIVVASAMQEVHTKQEYTTVEDLVKSAEVALQLAIVE